MARPAKTSSGLGMPASDRERDGGGSAPRADERLGNRTTADLLGAETQPAAARARPAGLLVDGEGELAPGQMPKGEFLAALRAAVCASTDQALAATGRDSGGCPVIEQWFGYYDGQDAAHVERSLRRYAPEAAGVATARDYIPIVTARVRRSVDTWAKTGEITGVPEDLPGGMPSMGGLLGSLAGVFFKPRPGGAEAEDPATVRDRLGPGQPLDGGLKTRMESVFGASFGGVRLHTDASGADLAQQMNARAFTVGEHVTFGRDEFHPDTVAGDALIAHELAHVAQQEDTSAAPTATATSGLEVDADRSAAAAVTSLWDTARGPLRRARPAVRSGLRLSRCSKSPRQQEIERLGDLQYGFLEKKRRDEEARLKKEAEEDAKKKGLPPPVTTPKFEMKDVVKGDVAKHELKGKEPTEWEAVLDKPAWRAFAKSTWERVVASVQGTELESVVKGVKFDFDPVKALKEGFYAEQDGKTLRVGMSWVRFADQDPKNAWENLAHEMAGHFEYGTTYSQEIMEAALSRMSSADRSRIKADRQGFFEAYEYPETEIFASLWQRRYRVPLVGAERPSGGIHPDINIVNKLNVMKDVLHPDVARAVLAELKRRVDANSQILPRDKAFFVAKVKEVFKYEP